MPPRRAWKEKSSSLVLNELKQMPGNVNPRPFTGLFKRAGTGHYGAKSCLSWVEANVISLKSGQVHDTVGYCSSTNSWQLVKPPQSSHCASRGLRWRCNPDRWSPQAPSCGTGFRARSVSPGFKGERHLKGCSVPGFIWDISSRNSATTEELGTCLTKSRLSHLTAQFPRSDLDKILASL